MKNDEPTWNGGGGTGCFEDRNEENRYSSYTVTVKTHKCFVLDLFCLEELQETFLLQSTKFDNTTRLILSHSTLVLKLRESWVSFNIVL